MPSITFSLKDLMGLLSRKISINELENLLTYCKADLENYDNKTDEVTINLGDTNLPYLYSIEGIARLLKGILNREKGLAKLKLSKGNYKVIVDDSVAKIRPFIAAFVVKDCKINDYILKQIIQLQEKLCESYGKKRKKIAIGIYSLNKVTFPIKYKAVYPEAVKFIPLDFKREMNLKEILNIHPKGQEYAYILREFDKYPLLIDSSNKVLSFPPIINAADLGKVSITDKDLFFEATGLDLESVNLAANIFAYAFSDRGFKVSSVDVKHRSKTITTPYSFNESVKVSSQHIKDLIGIELNSNDVKKLLEKARYDFNNFTVKIPDYRRDIMHPVDVIEDIAIMHGFDNIKEEPMKSYTIGETSELVEFIDRIREVIIGLGYQEIMSPILHNKEASFVKMKVKDFGSVELQNVMSQGFSILRPWLLPVVIEVLSKNKHIDYPQRIFEEGLVTIRKDDETYDYNKLAIVSAHNKGDFTEAKQVLEVITKLLGVEYSLQETEHGSFIPGRVGKIIVKGKDIGLIGEIHPSVLENWQLEVPVAALELNLNELYNILENLNPNS